MLKTVEYIVGLILLILVQIFIFDNINIMGYVSPYVYIMFIMILPMQIQTAPLILIAFGMGAIMDLVTGSVGLCAMCTTFIAFIRPTVLLLISGREVINNGGMPSVRTMEFPRFILYITIMTLAYNLPFMMLEKMSFSDFGVTLARIGFSTIFTVFVIYLSHLTLIRKTTKWQ